MSYFHFVDPTRDALIGVFELDLDKATAATSRIKKLATPNNFALFAAALIDAINSLPDRLCVTADTILLRQSVNYEIVVVNVLNNVMSAWPNVIRQWTSACPMQSYEIIPIGTGIGTHITLRSIPATTNHINFQVTELQVVPHPSEAETIDRRTELAQEHCAWMVLKVQGKGLPNTAHISIARISHVVE